MDTTVNEVLQFVKENDVKFIRLAFCDLFGRQKNISIMPDMLKSAFTEGISFDASAVRGFADVTESDLFLHPDPATLAVLPWRPQQGRVVRFYCDITHPDGTPFACDCRGILKRMTKRCEQAGYACKIGAECEFYLFKTDENGMPTDEPFDNGGYMDVSPLDKGENVRREICLTLEEMGLSPESSHHEQGPGQNEIDFKFSDALFSADNIITFQSAVRVIAQRNGLYASFAPKPIADQSGNGMHINLSLSQNGRNVFEWADASQKELSESFIAGVLEKIPEITAFLNPTKNSYERFGAFEAPKYVSWSPQNRSQLVRIPAARGEKMRMELRSPDPTANPYIAYALIIGAGLHGIEKKLPLPAPVNVNLYHATEEITQKLTALPHDFANAISLAKNSQFAKEILGETAFLKYITIKEAEI